MYSPKQLRTKAAHKKLQALGTTTLLGISLISCSGTASNTSSVTQPPFVATTIIPTPTLQGTKTTGATEILAPILPTAIPILPTATAVKAGQYIDGEYLGDSVSTNRWGYTQVRALINDGMLVDVEITEYPHSKSRSAQISAAALPILISEAIDNQNADIDILTRATDVSIAFIRSLDSALSEARAEGS